MGRNDYRSVREILDEFLENPDVSTSTGALKFIQADKRVQGRLFLNEGMIYGIMLTNYPTNIVQRLFSAGVLDDENQADVAKRFSRDLSNPSVIDYVLMYQMVSEKDVAEIVKNYFVDALDELYSWSAVKVEWRAKEQLESPIIIREVEPATILKVARNRAAYLYKAAEDFQMNIGDLGGLTFTNHGAVPSTQAEINVLSKGDGSHMVNEVNSMYSMSMFITVKTLHEAWKQGTVALAYNGVRIRSYEDAYPPEAEAVIDEPQSIAPVVSEVEPITPSIPMNEEDVPLQEVVEPNYAEADSISMDETPSTSNTPAQAVPSWLPPRPSHPSSFIAPDRKPVVHARDDENTVKTSTNEEKDNAIEPSIDLNDTVPYDALRDSISEDYAQEESLPTGEEKVEAIEVPLDEPAEAVEPSPTTGTFNLSPEELQAVLEENTVDAPPASELRLAPAVEDELLAPEQTPVEENLPAILDAVATSNAEYVDAVGTPEDDEVQSAHEDLIADYDEPLSALNEEVADEPLPEVADETFTETIEEIVEDYVSEASTPVTDGENLAPQGSGKSDLITIIRNAVREFEDSIKAVAEEEKTLNAEIALLESELAKKKQRKEEVSSHLADVRSQYKEAAKYLNSLREQ